CTNVRRFSQTSNLPVELGESVLITPHPKRFTAHTRPRGCPKFLPCCEAGFRGCEARPRRSAPHQASACLRCSLLRRASRSRLQPLATGINLGQPLASETCAAVRAFPTPLQRLVNFTLVVAVLQVCGCSNGTTERDASLHTASSTEASSPTNTASDSVDAADDSGGTVNANTPDSQELTLTTPAFESVAECSTDTPEVCGVFPDDNVSFMEGSNLSPQLDWAGVPVGTQSFAVVLEDVSFGQTHWALWNIPGDLTTLPAAVAQDSTTP